MTIEWVQGDLWEKWGEMAQPPYGTVQESYYVEDGQIHWGYFGDYRWYSGYGGGVFINRGSNVTFIDCTISGNLAQGGLSGLGGDEPGAGPQRVKPFPRKYEIPSFGGGVYCADDTTVTFIGCTITDNISSDPSYDHTLDAEGPEEGDRIEEEYEPNNPYSIDPYLGHGGGVCAEDTATVIFTDCTFSENEAAAGGGIHFANANPIISDCNFTNNSAFQGGGLFGEHGPATINNSNFTDNEAVSDPNDPNVVILGSGGGLHLWATEADIIDCNISSNQAEASGGGVFFGGEGAPLLINCLLTNNTAGRDGGGVSTNIFTQLTISNCTIAENIVTGVGFGTGYGGGLYCSYDSYTNIIDSIIWGNMGNIGAQGSQLAIGTAFKYDPGPSTVNVTYSDIQDATDPNAFGARIEALDLVFCIDSTGSMFDDIDAVRDAAYEITGAIVTEIPDSRIAVVEYKDFNQPNLDPAITVRYGDETDYPYRTVLGFTTDTSEVVAALDSLTASGGADWPESVYTALMHCIDHNSLAEALDGELYGADPASMGLGAWRSGNVMRVIILMGDAPPHDPEPFTDYTLEDIIAAAGVSGIEPKHVVPLLIGDDAEAASYFESLAEETGGTVLQVAGAEEVVEAIMEAIELISRIPDPILVEAGCILNWDPNSYSWDPDSHNIDEDPYFVSGYYLSQIAAGQDANSPCVDAGSDLAANLGLDTYTTRTDSFPDTYDPNNPDPCSVIVDMGYHYPLFEVPQYELTVTAIEVSELPEEQQPVVEPDHGFYNWYITVTLTVTTPVPDGYQALWTGTNDDESTETTNTVTMDSDKVVTVTFVKDAYDLKVEVVGPGGSVSPIGTNTYPRGTVVNLTAYPDEDYRFKQWTGTDNDASAATTNTVTMYSDKTVTAEFELPATFTVPGDYPTIQEAIVAARDHDKIIIASGVYTPSISGFIIDKEIMLTSTNPDDPNVVAVTVINPVNRAFFFTSNAGPGAVLNGITIADGGFGAIPADDGDDPGENGGDGYGTEGGAIYISTGSSPTIQNCVITGFNLFGGDAGSGADANEGFPGGRGGWAGWARGGGVYIASNSSPTFINCTISNCTATGGNAGDGGNGAEDETVPWWQPPGYGGNWSDGILWQLWGYIGDYRYYSAYGGGVYCGENSDPCFIACTITGNSTQGGMSGVGGLTAVTELITNPAQSYEIPSYGGGVYCGAGSTVVFKGCTITNNVAPKPGVDEADEVVYHLDPYLGHGGGIAFEETASIIFEEYVSPTTGEVRRCVISGNVASVGGGMYWANAAPEISDCNVSDNLAYQGGGLFGTNGSAIIENCIIQGNFAGTAPNDVDDLAGQGGGIYSTSMVADIFDCNIFGNEAGASGGGIFFTGITDLPIVTNCLITNNLAGRDGGGISVNWYSEPIIANCTVVGNEATGDFGEFGNTGFGGGLYCSYESNSEVIDSIFWNNNAVEGDEIAVGTGFEFDPRPATLKVTYSDIKGGRPALLLDTGCTLLWDVDPGDPDYPTNIDANPLFATGPLGGYYLSQTDANSASYPGQDTDSPCVDAGSDLASHLEMNRYTTRTDNEFDKGKVDMGYHYPLPEIAQPCRLCDLVYDGIINFRDFAIFALNWLEEGCSDADDWCQGADLTFDTYVDFEDLAFFVECWLEEDTTVPEPDPSEWEIEPYSASATPPYSISMTAKTAVDAWGWDVEYYFQRTDANGSPDGSFRGWDPNSIYIDDGDGLGLDPNTKYGYRVRVRDGSKQIPDDGTGEPGNKTDWSVTRYAVVGEEEDLNPPTPNPMTWAVPSYTATPNSITLFSTTATDDTSGVEYYFENFYAPVYNSGWIGVPTWTDTGLTPDTTYTYRVRARDTSVNQNQTGWSTLLDANTLPEGVVPDTTPPTPDPMLWADGGLPEEIWGGPEDFYYAQMTAEVATDDNYGVEYNFICTTNSGFSSGWQGSNTYTKLVGMGGQAHMFYVIAHDLSPNQNETGPSSTVAAIPRP
ncbi:hypothetical protein ES703_23094 [subsurface metagenome]